MSEPILLTMAEYSRWRGVSQEAVRKAILNGRIKVTEVNGQRLVNRDEADAAWKRNSDPTRQAGGLATQAKFKGEASKKLSSTQGSTPDSTDDEGNGTFHRWKVRREAAMAKLAELELARETGELVKAEDVAKVATKKAAIVREALLGIPDRIAGQVASETDPHKVHVILKEEIRLALEELTQHVG